MTAPKDPLDPVLDAWGSAPDLTPLAPEVWRRVAHAQASAARPRPTGWWSAVEIVFGRASFAAAFVVACVLLGLFLAEVRVSKIRTTRDRQLAETYLRLIDPLLVDSSRPAPVSGS